jgi:hypothetical protein
MELKFNKQKERRKKMKISKNYQNKIESIKKESGLFDDFRYIALTHSKDYVLKIAHELNYTIEDVRSQVSRYLVSRYLDGNLSTEEAVFFLRYFKANDIRYILTFNKV